MCCSNNFTSPPPGRTARTSRGCGADQGANQHCPPLSDLKDRTDTTTSAPPWTLVYQLCLHWTGLQFDLVNVCVKFFKIYFDLSQQQHFLFLHSTSLQIDLHEKKQKQLCYQSTIQAVYLAVLVCPSLGWQAGVPIFGPAGRGRSRCWGFCRTGRLIWKQFFTGTPGKNIKLNWGF